MTSSYIAIDGSTVVIPSTDNMVHVNIIKSIVDAKVNEINELNNQVDELKKELRLTRKLVNENEKYRQFYQLMKGLLND